MTDEHYGTQIEGLAKYRDVMQPGLAYIYSHCLVNLHYDHELTHRERRQADQPHGLIIALAQVYSADEIVRRLVKGLAPADLARLGREQPT